MRVPLYLTIASFVSCLAVEAAAEPYTAEPPDLYVALGVRAFAHDPTAIVLAGKLRLFDVGPLSTSVRDALLYGDYFEARISATLEAVPLARTAPFLGLGMAYNTDGLGQVDPMATAGIDVRVTRRVTVSATVNIIWQRTVGDTDKEGMGTLGFAF